MDYDEIANEITANAGALAYEVVTLAELYDETDFLGDNRHFPHAHYGYLMACMGQIDLMSRCEYGRGEPQGGQSVRMQNFMERYFDARKVDEHRVAIQLMRHTLMHTGALRYLYQASTETAYTWRIHFGDTFPAAQFDHYSLSVEDASYQDHLLAAVSGNVATVKALNLQLTLFAADVGRVAAAYTTALRADAVLQTKCELAYPGIRVQDLR